MENLKSNVEQKDGCVVVKGVKGFHAGQYASSVHGSQARILQTLGERLSYEDLVCYSGFAFRTGLHKQMCPSAGHPCCGFMCINNSTRAIPWKMKMFEVFPWGKKKTEEEKKKLKAEAYAAIKESIDHGIPVHYGSEEDGLIIGYADEGRRWWCVHPYYKGGSVPFWHDEVKGFAGGKWPWGIVVWEGPKPAEKLASDKELTLSALKQAVEMWNTEKRGDYFVGDTAYENWLKWLQEVENGKVKNPKAGMQGNGWCYDVLIQNRRIAADWLRKKSENYNEAAAEQLRIAADHYDKIVEVCMKDIKCPWDLALQPNKFDQWTSEMRKSQISRLETARKHDATAIAAIKKALENME